MYFLHGFKILLLLKYNRKCLKTNFFRFIKRLTNAFTNTVKFQRKYFRSEMFKRLSAHLTY